MIQKYSKEQRTVIISGKVVKGDRYGTVLGFPTANLDRRSYSRLEKKPKFGVYAGMVKIIPPRRPPQAEPSPPKIGGELKGWYKAGIVIGPLDNRGLPKIEAHLIGFKGNLYGEKVVLHLVKFIRFWKNFKSETQLRKQIKQDVNIVKKIINAE